MTTTETKHGQSSTQNGRILILEDEHLLRDLLSNLFGDVPGLEIAGSAADGREALKLCESVKPDIVIFEMYLPGLNGIEILRQYSPKNPDARFLSISSQFTPDTIRELLELGCHGIVSKSSSAAKLREGLDEILLGNGYLCPNCASLLRKSHLVGGSLSKRRSRLSNREREVLQAVAEGYSTKQIAEMLEVSVKTIEAHRANLMKKLDSRSAVELTRRAFELGIIELPGQQQPVAFTAVL